MLVCRVGGCFQGRGWSFGALRYRVDWLEVWGSGLGDGPYSVFLVGLVAVACSSCCLGHIKRSYKVGARQPYSKPCNPEP